MTTAEPLKLDPMVEPLWTLAMTAAWIIWRTPNAVLQAWHEYRSKVEKPIDEPIKGPDLFQARIYGKQSAFGLVSHQNRGRLPDVTLFDVLAQRAYDPDNSLLTGTQARLEMWRRLGAGDLPAEGIPEGSNERVPIRASEWTDLDYFDNEKWQADDIGTDYSGIRRYSKVRVTGARVRALWPPINDSDVTPPLPPKQRIPPKQAAVLEAIDNTWPDGIPVGLMGKERNAKIIEFMKSKGLSPPSSQTIFRAIKSLNLRKS